MEIETSGLRSGDSPGTMDCGFQALIERISDDALFEIHQCLNFRIADDSTKIGERTPGIGSPTSPVDFPKELCNPSCWKPKWRQNKKLMSCKARWR